MSDKLNILERCIQDYKLDEVKTMNGLQSAGIVSDNCVRAHDVAEADCLTAVERIKRRHVSFVVSNFP